MKILILGATGMLGHRLVADLGQGFAVTGVLRGDARAWAEHPALRGRRLLSGLDAMRPESIAPLLDAERPDVVINCIGIIKQLAQAKDPVPCITLNALLPQRLAELCQERGLRLVHFSTDCVFSGAGGPYFEDGFPDARDLYGRTKLLGEVEGQGCLTLRTSIIGHELRGGASLIEWFLAQRGGQAKGFARALYTGLTTNAIGAVVARVIEDFPAIEGLFHVAAAPIDKFTLLSKVNKAYGLGISLERDEAFFCDRRLDGSRFLAATGIVVPEWDVMIETMRARHESEKAGRSKT